MTAIITAVPRNLLLAAASAALLAAGCGGGGGGAEYTLAPTLGCLTAAGLDATEESATANPLAGGKPDIDVDYGDYDVYVIFADDSGAAKKIAAGVNQLSAGFGGEGDGYAPTKGNVVMYSNGEKISAENQGQIEDCLTERVGETSFGAPAGHEPEAPQPSNPHESYGVEDASGSTRVVESHRPL